MIRSETSESASSITWRARSAGFGVFGGDRLSTDGLALVSVEIDMASRLIRSITPAKLISAPIGIWIGTVVRPSLLSSCGDDVDRVRSGAVHLVDEGEPRNAIPLHLAVDGDRLRLNSRDGAEDEHGSVENAERSLNLNGEIDVTRGVDDVDLLVFPLNRGRRRGDRDPSLFLQFHVVHLGALAADLFDRVALARIEERPVRSALSCPSRCGRRCRCCGRSERFSIGWCSLHLGRALNALSSQDQPNLARVGVARPIL